MTHNNPPPPERPSRGPSRRRSGTPPPDRKHSHAAHAFPELFGFDARDVPTRVQRLRGLTTVPAGTDPSDLSVGQSCGRTDCPYQFCELTIVPSREALIVRHIVSVLAYANIPADLLYRGLTLDVYEVTSEPIEVADLSRYPMRFRTLDLTIDGLRYLGSQHDAQLSLEWEIIRRVKNAVHPGAIELQSFSGPDGRDLLLARDTLSKVAFHHRGSFQDEVPLVYGKGTYSLSRIADAAARVVRFPRRRPTRGS